MLVIQTADITAYAHEVQTLQALYKKAAVALKLRVRHATYAGADTGTVVVGVEAPNLAILEKMREQISSNPELAAQMKKITAMRKVVSDSLYEPLTD